MSAATRRLGFAHGLKALPRAAGVLWRAPRLLLWLAPPFLITLLLDALVLYLAFDWMRDWIAGLLPASGWFAPLRTLLDIVAALVVLVLLAWCSIGLYLVLASPFQDFLSAGVEKAVRGRVEAEPPGFGGFLRCLSQNLLQAVVLTFAALLFLVVALVPVLGPVLYFLWSSFALGFCFVSIHSGRTGQSFAERRAFVRRHLGAVMGLGMGMAVVGLVPFAPVVLLPLFVVAGTLLHLDAADSR